MTKKKTLFAAIAVLLLCSLSTELRAQTARLITTAGVVYVRSIQGAITIAGVVTGTSFVAAAAGNHSWTGRSVMTSPSNGNVLLTNAAASDFGLLQFGGTTTSFPALKRSTSSLQVRLGDDSTYTTLQAATLQADNIGPLSGGVPLIRGADPTISSGFGTSPSVVSGANGPGAFLVNVGTGGTASSGVIATTSAATNGWVCSVTNRTAVAANRADQRTVQTATTTTTVTVQNQTISTGAALAWTASDVLALNCFAH